MVSNFTQHQNSHHISTGDALTMNVGKHEAMTAPFICTLPRFLLTKKVLFSDVGRAARHHLIVTKQKMFIF